MAEAIDAPEEMSSDRAADHHRQDPRRQDRRGHRPQGQDHQPDPGRHRRDDLHRGRRHDLHRCHQRRRGRGGRARRSTRSPTRRCPRSASATSAPSSRRPTSAPSSRCMPGKDGLLHISKLRPLAGGKRVENVEDVVSVGQKIQVEIGEIDDRGKLSLIPVVEETRRGRAAEPAAEAPRRPDLHVAEASTTTGPQATAGRSSGPGARRPRPRPAPSRSRHHGHPPDRHRRRRPGDLRRSVVPSCPAGCGSITERAAGVRSASIGVWVGVGSRDESATLHGCSHFLEHLLFKGTSTRSALDISIALDAVGGEFNAFTAKEYTCFHARVLDEDLPLAVDVLGDMITSSLLTPEDVEAERDVILDEIAMHDDDPDDVVHNLFAEQACGRGHAAGPPDRRHRRSRSTRSPVRRSHASTARHYRPATMVVAVAGNVDHAALVEQVRAAFGRNDFLAGDERPVAAARRRPAPCRCTRARSGDPALRAGQRRARHGGHPPQRRPPLRPRRAQHRARRRHVEPAVPGGPRAPRAGLLGLLLRQPPRRLRPGRGLGRLPAAPSSTTSSPSSATELAQGRRPRHHRRGARPRQGPAARRPRARPRGLRLPDVAHRQGRAGPRRAARASTRCSPGSTPSPSTTCARSRPPSSASRRSWPWSAPRAGRAPPRVSRTDEAVGRGQRASTTTPAQAAAQSTLAKVPMMNRSVAPVRTPSSAARRSGKRPTP